MRLLKQDLFLPGLLFGWDLLLPTAPPSVRPIPEFSCLALLPRNQSSSPAAWGGDWQMHTGWLSGRRVGVASKGSLMVHACPFLPGCLAGAEGQPLGVMERAAGTKEAILLSFRPPRAVPSVTRL